MSDLSHIKVKGGTIQRVFSKAAGTPQAELIINPLFSVSNGQGLGATAMDARGLIFPQATISSSPTDPNLAEVNFNVSGAFPIIVDGTTYSYSSVEFMDFTAAKVGNKLQLTAPQTPTSAGIEIDNCTSNIAV